MFGRLFAPEPVPADANVLRLVIEPGPVRDSVRNWAAVVPALLDRTRREAVGGVLDPDTAELVSALRGGPTSPRLLAAQASSTSTGPVIDLRFAVGDVELAFFSVISTVGTPIDITAQELRVEAFFPADADTGHRWAELTRAPPDRSA